MEEYAKMDRINIGVLGPSETAFNCFVPAILSDDKFKYIGVACANTRELSSNMLEDEFYVKVENIRAIEFQEEYGGEIFYSYNSLLSSEIIDAVYISLDPGVYFKWVVRAVEKGKHVLFEKPYISLVSDTQALIEVAESRGIAFYESCDFMFSAQISEYEQYKSEAEHFYRCIMNSKAGQYDYNVVKEKVKAFE
jgi:predicted dehydrogenase